MIDTVTFRIHDLNLHTSVLKILQQKNDPTQGHRLDITDQPDNISHEAKRLWGQHITFFDTGRVKTIQEKREFNSSCHYAVANRIDYNNDYIELSLSIPKYIHGTNIVQYIPHFTSRNFLLHDNIQIGQNLSGSFSYLQRFFNFFFRKEFPECRIIKQNFEINRIDLAYNQVFQSKEDALIYLNDIRKVRKKFSRETSRMINHTTTFSYVTDRYSFKVYHKGTEYRKHDRQKHLKINREKDRQIFPVEQYQTFADKILRYEATFRSTYIDYLYQQHIFKKDCPYFQTAKKISKKLETLEGSERTSYIKSLDREQKFLTKLYKHYTSYKKTYVWQVSKQEQELLESTDIYGIKQGNLKYFKKIYYAPFDEQIFSLLAKKFQSFIGEFQILENISTQDVVKKAEEYNGKIQFNKDSGIKTVDSKINVHRLQMLLNFVKENNYTIQDLRNHKILPDRSYYRFVNQLKQIGVSHKNLTFETIQANFDLREYHAYIMENSKIFPRLNFL